MAHGSRRGGSWRSLFWVATFGSVCFVEAAPSNSTGADDFVDLVAITCSRSADCPAPSSCFSIQDADLVQGSCSVPGACFCVVEIDAPNAGAPTTTATRDHGVLSSASGAGPRRGAFAAALLLGATLIGAQGDG
eukprot:CAMPEP_0203924618 /NCGR_PEP_ID=MMETSP0359-20131031/64349_1 /ASSEMBLY_ACC=CAM_ASM_000338 /TAXON_ID=268821 /ORGANISM="Scrippsiella Hangoei, Strain SHTV-5" /LENGTH=133 /DNA_ID=CAMNT_0050852879 /DNA_START=36 /DNA_END=437 /DNA_ORIENTATION=-